MQINIRYLDNLKIEASFDGYKVISDQPVRYKGDATAPGPFDYFLASSALCGAYFVKLYCQTRNIDTSQITIIQNNIVDPENRYHQDFCIDINLPEGLSEKDKRGIKDSFERCTVKRVIQNSPKFSINTISHDSDHQNGMDLLDDFIDSLQEQEHFISGKDASLEKTIRSFSKKLKDLDIHLEISAWRNPLKGVWSLHLRDADAPLCYTNGKGQTKEAALASALGEFFERLSTNYFYNDYAFNTPMITKESQQYFHYPFEKWFEIEDEKQIPKDLLDTYCLKLYNPDKELRPHHLIDMNSGHLKQNQICALPFARKSDQEKVYFPISILSNLYVSNGMSAGNTFEEAEVQALSEIFERAIKHKIIREQIALPDVPMHLIEQYPLIHQGIEQLNKTHHVIIKDASLGGKFPVLCIITLSSKTQGAYASFGAHPSFHIALERCLTELLQGRSLNNIDEMPSPSFQEHTLVDSNNIIDHFIDSSGVIPWQIFSKKSNYEFQKWNFKANTRKEELTHLYQFLKDLNYDTYVAHYDHCKVPTCRIIVPGFSEIYEIEDLVWDNNNRALKFRNQIINLHSLTENELHDLYETLEEEQLDDYMLISELIGLAFDETTPWARLCVCELKLLINLKLQNLEAAQTFTSMLMNYSDLSTERKKLIHCLSTLLDCIEYGYNEPPLNTIENYKDIFLKMYGEHILTKSIEMIQGDDPWYGLVPLNLETLSHLPKHQEILQNKHKAHKYFKE